MLSRHTLSLFVLASSPQVLAEKHVDHMLENCNDEPHAEAGIEEGQNVAGEKGMTPQFSISNYI